MMHLLLVTWFSQGETVKGLTYRDAEDKTMITFPQQGNGIMGGYYGGKGSRLIWELGRRDEETHSKDYAWPKDGQIMKRPNVQTHDLNQRHKEA